MEAYLIDLIERMGTKQVIEKGVTYSSKDSISFNAHREAELLSDKSYIGQLSEYILAEKDKSKRGDAYFVLSKLLRKTNHESARVRIREVIGQEEHKQYKNDIVYAAAVLGQIGEERDLDLLQPLLSSRIRDIKGSAGYAIQHINDRCHKQ